MKAERQGKGKKPAKKEHTIVFYHQHRGRKTDKQSGHLWGAESLTGEMRFWEIAQCPGGRQVYQPQWGSWGHDKYYSWDYSAIKKSCSLSSFTKARRHENSQKQCQWKLVKCGRDPQRPGTSPDASLWTQPDAWRAFKKDRFFFLNLKKLHYQAEEKGRLGPLLSPPPSFLVLISLIKRNFKTLNYL